MLVTTEVPLFSLASRRQVDGKNEDACHFHTFTLALKEKHFLTCTQAFTNFAKSAYLASNSLICLNNNNYINIVHHIHKLTAVVCDSEVGELVTTGRTQQGPI